MATVSSQKWLTYLDLPDVMGWLQIPGAPTPNPTLQRITDMACAWVQNFLNRPVAATQFTERHDGWSGEYIMLKHSPFLQLVSCTEYMSSGGPITLAESTPENPVEGIQIDYATSRIMRTFAGYSWPRTFFPGSRNIEVTYVAGYNPIPPDIWLATAEFVAHWWRNTQQNTGNRPGGADYDPGETGSGMWAGVPYRVIDLLEPYRQIAIG